MTQNNISLQLKNQFTSMMDLSKVTLEELEKLLKRKLKDEADKYFFDLITVLVIWIISHLFL